MVLHLSPQLVGELTQIEPVPQVASFEPAARGWITRERSPVGHTWRPASRHRREGPDAFPNLLLEDVVAFLERVIAWDGRSWNG